MNHNFLRNPAISSKISVKGIAAVHARHYDEQLRRIPVEELERSPWQPRSRIVHDADFDSLVDSVREHGILQPILVREADDGTLALIAGERRLRAAMMVGLTDIPARVFEGISDVQAREIAIVENLIRTDLCPFDIACALKALREVRRANQLETDVRSLEIVSGRAKTQVHNFLFIADRLTPEVLEHARQIVGAPTLTLRTFTASALKRAATMDAPASRAEALAKIIGGSPSRVGSRAAYEVVGSPSDTMRVKIVKPVALLTPSDATALRALLLPLMHALEQRGLSEFG